MHPFAWRLFFVLVVQKPRSSLSVSHWREKKNPALALPSRGRAAAAPLVPHLDQVLRHVTRHFGQRANPVLPNCSKKTKFRGSPKRRALASPFNMQGTNSKKDTQMGRIRLAFPNGFERIPQDSTTGSRCCSSSLRYAWFSTRQQSEFLCGKYREA